MSRVQDEIGTVGTGLVKARNYLVCQLEYSNDQMFSDILRKLVEEGGQEKMNIYKEFKQTVNVYKDRISPV